MMTVDELLGPLLPRSVRLSEMVPVRFPPDLLDEIRRRAKADDRSLSSWIRCAAEHELSNSARYQRNLRAGWDRPAGRRTRITIAHLVGAGPRGLSVRVGCGSR